jgi:hypothetical protein
MTTNSGGGASLSILGRSILGRFNDDTPKLVVDLHTQTGRAARPSTS